MFFQVSDIKPVISVIFFCCFLSLVPYDFNIPVYFLHVFVEMN